MFGASLGAARANLLFFLKVSMVSLRRSLFSELRPLLRVCYFAFRTFYKKIFLGCFFCSGWQGGMGQPVFETTRRGCHYLHSNGSNLTFVRQAFYSWMHVIRELALRTQARIARKETSPSSKLCSIAGEKSYVPAKPLRMLPRPSVARRST